MSDSLNGWWLNMELPPERCMSLEISRRQIPQLSPAELQAIHDSLLVALAHKDHMLNQAMRKVAELELRLFTCETTETHQRWAREISHELGVALES